MPEGHRALFDVLCQTEDNRMMLQDKDVPMQCDDDDVCSVASSYVGSLYELGHSNVDEDEDGSDNEGTHNPTKLLKGVGNISKKPMSLCILKDVLEDDGEDAIHDIKKNFEKDLAIEKRKFDMIKIANRHFENKMEKRMKCIHDKTEKSRLGSYVRRSIPWRDKYDEIITTTRVKDTRKERS